MFFENGLFITLRNRSGLCIVRMHTAVNVFMLSLCCLEVEVLVFWILRGFSLTSLPLPFPFDRHSGIMMGRGDSVIVCVCVL
jgi:hypothetical protein